MDFFRKVKYLYVVIKRKIKRKLKHMYQQDKPVTDNESTDVEPVKEEVVHDKFHLPVMSVTDKITSLNVTNNRVVLKPGQLTKKYEDGSYEPLSMDESKKMSFVLNFEAETKRLQKEKQKHKKRSTHRKRTK